MHKVLWDAVIKCKSRREKQNVDERIAYCACCPLGSECGEVDEQEGKCVDLQGIIVREKEDVVRMFEQMLRTPYQ